MFCWRCHRDGTLISCETCPRSYHQKCVKQTVTNRERWPCPECVAILKAESTKTRYDFRPYLIVMSVIIGELYILGHLP